MPLIRSDRSQGPPAEGDPCIALASGSAGARWRAVRDVAALPEGPSILAGALARETDGRVRDAIFTSLSQSPQGLSFVLPYVRSDDAQLRTGALDALRAAAALIEPLLTEIIADPDPDVRLLICEVVRELPSPTASRLMIELLERELEVNVCGAAMEVLAEVGDASALPALERCARRFADEPFLTFSARVAAQRISGPRGRG